MANSVITITLFVLIVVFLVTAMFLQTATNANNELTHSHIPRKTNINPNIHKIHHGLYLTDFKNAKDYESLKALGVRQILTI